MDYTEEDLMELYDIIVYPDSAFFLDRKNYTTVEAFKSNPLSYEVISAPLSKMPLYLTHYVPHVRSIAKWRLEHGK